MNFTGLNLPDWFGPLCEEIERELARLSQTENDRRPAMREGDCRPSRDNPWLVDFSRQAGVEPRRARGSRGPVR